MNFNNPICPLLHLFLSPLPLPPPPPLLSWGEDKEMGIVCVCKVVVYGRGLHFSFPSCASLTQLLLPSQPIHLSFSSSYPALFLSPPTPSLLRQLWLWGDESEGKKKEKKKEGRGRPFVRTSKQSHARIQLPHIHINALICTNKHTLTHTTDDTSFSPHSRRISSPLFFCPSGPIFAPAPLLLHSSTPEHPSTQSLHPPSLIFLSSFSLARMLALHRSAYWFCYKRRPVCDRLAQRDKGRLHQAALNTEATSSIITPWHKRRGAILTNSKSKELGQKRWVLMYFPCCLLFVGCADKYSVFRREE